MSHGPLLDRSIHGILIMPSSVADLLRHEAYRNPKEMADCVSNSLFSYIEIHLNLKGLVGVDLLPSVLDGIRTYLAQVSAGINSSKIRYVFAGRYLVLQLSEKCSSDERFTLGSVLSDLSNMHLWGTHFWLESMFSENNVKFASAIISDTFEFLVKKYDLDPESDELVFLKNKGGYHLVAYLLEKDSLTKRMVLTALKINEISMMERPRIMSAIHFNTDSRVDIEGYSENLLVVVSEVIPLVEQYLEEHVALLTRKVEVGGNFASIGNLLKQLKIT